MGSVDERPGVEPHAPPGGDAGDAHKRRAESAEARVRVLAIQLEQARSACSAAEQQAEDWRRRFHQLQSEPGVVRGAGAPDEELERLREQHADDLERAVTAHAIRLQEVRSAAEGEVKRLQSELAGDRAALDSARTRIEALAADVQELQQALSDAASERDRLRGELEYLRAQTNQDRASRRPPPVMDEPVGNNRTSRPPRSPDARPDGTYIITDGDIHDNVGDPRRRRKP